jgi:hypothetical protein
VVRAKLHSGSHCRLRTFHFEPSNSHWERALSRSMHALASGHGSHRKLLSQFWVNFDCWAKSCSEFVTKRCFLIWWLAWGVRYSRERKWPAWVHETFSTRRVSMFDCSPPRYRCTR